jgi:LysM repeat protein
MKKPVIHHMILLLCVLVVILLPVNAQDGNLLQNPGFEEPFNTLDGDPPLQVAQGWTPWHVPAAVGAPSFANRQPEYGPSTERVVEGSTAQIIREFFATHDGGVYQRVTGITPGDMLHFSIFAYVWSSMSDNEETSTDNGDVMVQVGIDPTGGTDPGAEVIVWSPEGVEEYDAYNEYTVDARAEADAVTVFVRTVIGVPVTNTDIYLDQASLTLTGEGTEEPTEEATDEAGATEEATEPAAIATEPPVETEETAVEPSTEEAFVTEETAEVMATEVQTKEATEELVTAAATATPTETSAPTETATEDTSVLTATAIIAEATATAAVSLTETANAPVATTTDDPLFLTATAVIAEATSTASANLTATASAPTPTEDTLFLTATAIIEDATATGDANLTATAGAVTPTEEATATATATEPPISEQFPETISHTVSRGDTVAILAERYGSTIEAIAQANGLDSSYFLQVGQVLVIPVPEAIELTPTPTAVVVTATPSGPVPALGTGNVYIVRPGDTLGRIARLFNTTVETLAQLNGIVNVNQIQVGQQLMLPEPSQPEPSAQATSTGTTTPPVSAQPQTIYTVRPGDSLYKISIMFGVPIAQIAQANNLSNRNRIYVGQTLIIP